MAVFANVCTVNLSTLTALFSSFCVQMKKRFQSSNLNITQEWDDLVFHVFKYQPYQCRAVSTCESRPFLHICDVTCRTQCIFAPVQFKQPVFSQYKWFGWVCMKLRSGQTRSFLLILSIPDRSSVDKPKGWSLRLLYDPSVARPQSD